MKEPRPLVTCARCKEQRPHMARSLCSRCDRASTDDGTLHNYPLTTVPAKHIIEEMGSGAMPGLSYVEVAMKLGLKATSARDSYYRARRRGLVA